MCSGSRSKISYGTRVPIQLGPVSETTYFDIVNLDRYDCVLGTPFMTQHGIVLDMKNKEIIVGKTIIPAFTMEQDAEARAGRKGDRTSCCRPDVSYTGKLSIPYCTRNRTFPDVSGIPEESLLWLRDPTQLGRSLRRF